MEEVTSARERTSFALGDRGLAQGVEQGRFAVVDMAHDCNAKRAGSSSAADLANSRKEDAHWRPKRQVAVVDWDRLGMDVEAALVVDDRVHAEFGDDQRGVLCVEDCEARPAVEKGSASRGKADDMRASRRSARWTASL